MRMLHTAVRVADLEFSFDFYSKLGFEQVGRVATGDGATLVMLKLPDDVVVTLELVSDPAVEPVEVGSGFSHLVVQVEDLDATRGALSDRGIDSEEIRRPGGADGPATSFVRDPDGRRIELVQWPPGHADGITEADFG